MNDIKLAVLGSEGAGKSALAVRFLTRRFIGEYASNSECIYNKRLCLDGRQMNLEIYDPCSKGITPSELWRTSKWTTQLAAEILVSLTLETSQCYKIKVAIFQKQDEFNEKNELVQQLKEFATSKRLTLFEEYINTLSSTPSGQPSTGKLSFSDELLWPDGFVVVYDISDRSSFVYAKTLIYRMRESSMRACKRDVDSVVFLIGNKQDLCHMREVTWEEGQKVATDNKCQFYEMSAAEHCQEVVNMFYNVIKTITTHFKLKEKRRPSGSKSMAKLINNVFGKRRKSV